MVQQLFDRKFGYMRADEIEALVGGGLDLGGQISIAFLAELAGEPISDHYEGPDHFDEVVTFGDHMSEHVKSKSTPIERRWNQISDIPEGIQARIEVLRFSDSGVKDHLDRITDLNAIISDLRTKEVDNTAQKAEYAHHVDQIMKHQIMRFRENLKSNTVAVTLLRGGQRFEKDFWVEPNRRLRTNAKRLDFGKKMGFGFTAWEGFEEIRESWEAGEFPDGIELAVVDDCGATFGSIEALYRALQRRHEEGKFPKINKIRIYVMVGAQPGVEDMFRNMAELGVDVEIVIGDMAYQLSDRGYIEVAPGETRSDGTPLPAGKQRVGDMGTNLTK